MAKTNFQYEKRQRDLAKKRKQEEKRQRKLDKGVVQSKTNTEESATPPESEPAGETPQP